MKIKFTDGYNKKTASNQQDIDVSGSCVITNYDPRTKKPSQKGDLTVSVDKGKATINGTVFQEDSAEVNFNEKKYSIFTKLATLDGDNSNLTIDDLEKAYEQEETLKAEIGATEIKYDRRAGVITIEFGNEVLRIDFKTWWERWGFVEDSSKLKPDTNIDTDAGYTEIANKDAKPEQEDIYLKNPDFRFHATEITQIAKLMKIPESELNKEISKIAKNIGHSEAFVKQIIIVEGFVRIAKDLGDGTITVGFGHTIKTESNSSFKKGYKVSNETAFKWLEQDIKDKIKLIDKFLGDCNWEETPKSVQNAIIDMVFNRGLDCIMNNEKSKTLKESLMAGRAGDIDSAINTRQIIKNPKTNNHAGIMKRNCYRFLMAIEDLSASKKLEAMERFNSSDMPYYTKTIALLNQFGYKDSARMLERDWNAVKCSAQQALGIDTGRGNIYEVQQGDNLINIAKKFNTTVAEIKKLNNIKNDSIKVGDELIIPQT